MVYLKLDSFGDRDNWSPVLVWMVMNKTNNLKAGKPTDKKALSEWRRRLKKQRAVRRETDDQYKPRPMTDATS